ncbi:hypothetical protein [Acinetobacter sp. P1(2025)]|uniref:hypothetical protein n=1 Tax=Acinetobacter sp. P1(2025) TaxID=3446120 RepID=UPI003F52D420
MFTTVCTTLFVLSIAYFTFRRGYRIASGIIVLIAVISFAILYRGEQQYLDVADKQIGERRTAILEMSVYTLDANPNKEQLSKAIKVYSEDDGVFSNRDYDKVKKFLLPNIVKEVNSHFKNADQEEAALDDITGYKAPK